MRAEGYSLCMTPRLCSSPFLTPLAFRILSDFGFSDFLAFSKAAWIFYPV